MTIDPNTDLRNIDSENSWNEASEMEALDALRILECSWHSNGQGPYGPYALTPQARFEGDGSC